MLDRGRALAPTWFDPVSMVRQAKGLSYWFRAELEPVRKFLIDEQKAGRFKPIFKWGLFDEI